MLLLSAPVSRRILGESRALALPLALSFFLLSGVAQATDVGPNGQMVPSSCAGGVIPICGVNVPAPAMTTMGNTTRVTVPPGLLGTTSTGGPVTFDVACVDNGNGAASFQLVNPQGISCNVFPCQASTVRLCDTNIPVAGGTPMGGVTHMTMPAPFAPNPFTVQCVGTDGAAPVYQISDHSAVTCK